MRYFVRMDDRNLGRCRNSEWSERTGIIEESRELTGNMQSIFLYARQSWHFDFFSMIKMTLSS